VNVSRSTGASGLIEFILATYGKVGRSKQSVAFSSRWSRILEGADAGKQGKSVSSMCRGCRGVLLAAPGCNLNKQIEKI
jgi:hypothetical protein